MTTREDLRNDGVLTAIDAHDTPKLFDWMVRAFSFQGIADAIASDYMDRHGALTWGAIADDLDGDPACPKLHSYWQFHDCGYRKIRDLQRARPFVGLSVANAPAAQWPPEPDRVQPVPVHSRHRRWRFGGLDRPAAGRRG